MEAGRGQRNESRANDGLGSQAANKRARSAAIRRLGFGRGHNCVGTWTRRGSRTEISEISSGRSRTRLRPLCCGSRRGGKQRLNSRNELLRADLRLGDASLYVQDRTQPQPMGSNLKQEPKQKAEAKQDESGNESRTSTSRCQPAASSQSCLHPRCTIDKNETQQGTTVRNRGQRRTTRNNDEQLGTTRNNDEQLGRTRKQLGSTRNNDEQRRTTRNNALPYPADSPLLSSAVALSLISHSMATSASSSRSWMLCASRDTSRFPISIVGRRGIAGWSSDEA